MEDFVSFKLAQKLKEKGFREKCFGYYGWCEDVFYYNVIQNPVPSRQLTFKDFEECQNTYRENYKYDAPTISQVLKWLREEKGIYVQIEYINDKFFGATIIIRTTGGELLHLIDMINFIMVTKFHYHMKITNKQPSRE